MGTDLAALRAVAADAVRRWRVGLAAARLPVVDVTECGSVRTGLFIGPKPASYSACPRDLTTERVVEVDVRIILAGGADPLDQSVLDAVTAVTGARLGHAGHIMRWETLMPQASLYRHTPWTAGAVVEWDVSVNVEPYVETAPWWSLAFSAEDVAYQRRLRHDALKRAVPRPVYESLKTVDARELRWRLCGALAVPTITATCPGLRQLRARLDGNRVLSASVAQARQGTLQRPDPAAVLDALRDHGVPIPPPPMPPPWVRRLEGASR